jgi:hypothetical protein
MPIAYFSDHVDLWSARGQIEWHLVGTKRCVLHDAGELWCYRLPDRGMLVRRNASPAHLAQFPESEWLANRLIEAAQAYQQALERSSDTGESPGDYRIPVRRGFEIDGRDIAEVARPLGDSKIKAFTEG